MTTGLDEDEKVFQAKNCGFRDMLEEEAFPSLLLSIHS